MGRPERFCRLLQKKSLGLVLFNRDGRVTANFFLSVSNLGQRPQPSESKLFHNCFTIIIQHQLQSTFFSEIIWEEQP